MAGHLGGATLAGYFFGELTPDLDAGVHLAVERDLERVMAGEESIWFNPDKAGITIPELFAREREAAKKALPNSGSTTTDRVAAALESSVDRLRQSGHNVIFASLAIRCFDSHPEEASEPVVAGVEKLLATFETAGPGRGYFGKEAGWKPGGRVDVSAVEAPRCEDPGMVVEIALEELVRFGGNHRRGFGGLIHLLDHAAAIVELANFGRPRLAERALPGFRHHVQLLRSLPILDEELGPLRKSERDPHDPEYWTLRNSAQFSAHLTHRIKVLYAFEVLRAASENETRIEQAEDAFRYLMA